MAKPETYYEELSRLQQIGDQLSPGRIILDATFIHQLTGESVRNIRRKSKLYGMVDGKTTYAKLALGLSKG